MFSFATTIYGQSIVVYAEYVLIAENNFLEKKNHAELLFILY
jgi:hypothetical protein